MTSFRIQSVLLVLLSFVLVSCFDNETKVSSKQSVQEVMEQRQNVAASYARGLQMHATAVVDVLMEQAQTQGDHVANLSAAGSIQGLSLGGLIDSNAFAALDAGGEGALNTARQRNMMQAGYCEGVLYTWLAGTQDADGVMQKARIKGLGESGLGGVSQVLAQHVGANSYGAYDNGVLTTPMGVNVVINCDELAAAIPSGTPVLFQEVAAEFELSRSGRFYEFENRACVDTNNEGFDRFRRLVEIEYNNDGAEIGRDSGDWELFLESCHDARPADRISIDIGSSTVDQIDFSALSLGSGSTKSVVCFKATTTKKDKDSGRTEAIDDSESFDNCHSAVDFETSLAPDVEVTCNNEVVRTEEDVRACTGDGWSGTVTYERDIYSCTKTSDGGSAIDYEKRGEWERTEISCSREETAAAMCPYDAGSVNYKRTNYITNPTTLSPTNPDWTYVNDNCATDETSSCIPAYAGNGLAFAPTASGASNPPTATTTSLAGYCGAGSLCDTQREVDCAIGSKTQKRSYICGAGWTPWVDDNIQECGSASATTDQSYEQSGCFLWGSSYRAGAAVIGREDEYSKIVGAGNYAALWDAFPDMYSGLGTLAVGPRTRVVLYSENNYAGEELLNVHGAVALMNKGEDCSKGSPCHANSPNWLSVAARVYAQDGTPPDWSDFNFNAYTSGFKNMYPPATRSYSDTEMTSCGGSGIGAMCIPVWFGSAKVTCDTCSMGDEETRSDNACPSGTVGTRTSTRSCEDNGQIYDWGDWSAWDESSCQTVICSAGSTETDTQSCDAGYTGNKTRTRTCNSTGTGYSSWSAWDTSACENENNLCTNYVLTADRTTNSSTTTQCSQGIDGGFCYPVTITTESTGYANGSIGSLSPDNTWLSTNIMSIYMAKVEDTHVGMIFSIDENQPETFSDLGFDRLVIEGGETFYMSDADEGSNDHSLFWSHGSDVFVEGQSYNIQVCRPAPTGFPGPDQNCPTRDPNTGIWTYCK